MADRSSEEKRIRERDLARKRRLADPDKHREASRRWRAKRSPEVIEKHNAYMKAYRQQNREYFRLKEQEWRHRNPARRMIKASRRSALQRGLDHEIVAEDLLPLPSHCPVLGIELDYTLAKTSFNSPSIDRIDNSKGYTKDNIIVVSYRANMIKNCANVDELYKIWNFYKDFN